MYAHHYNSLSIIIYEKLMEFEKLWKCVSMETEICFQSYSYSKWRLSGNLNLKLYARLCIRFQKIYIRMMIMSAMLVVNRLLH